MAVHTRSGQYLTIDVVGVFAVRRQFCMALSAVGGAFQDDPMHVFVVPVTGPRYFDVC